MRVAVMKKLWKVLSLTLCLALSILTVSEPLIPNIQAQPWRYLEYPTQTWIIERQDYFGTFLEWTFVPVDGQHGDKRLWNFTWQHLDYIDLNETHVLENPIFDVRLALGNETWLREIYNKTEPLWFKTWGNFTSDVVQLHKYPIVPEDKEEFEGLHTNIDILNGDNGTFQVSFKDRWKAGKKITIGFGSTITYSGATNTITITGTSSANGVFWDFWNASNINGWNVSSQTCENASKGIGHEDRQFLFDCLLQIGDGSTSTSASDANKQVTFSNTTITANAQKLIRIMNNGQLTLGVLDDLATKSTIDGCQIYDADVSFQYTYIIFGEVGSTVYLYASSFSGDTGAYRHYLRGRGTTRLWNCLGNGISLQSDTNLNVYNWNSMRPAYGIFFGSGGGTYEKITFLDVYAQSIYVYSSYAITVNNVYIRLHDYLSGIRATSITVDNHFINVDTDNWIIFWTGTSTAEIYRQYEFDLTVTDSVGIAIENANVTITYDGQGGGTVGTWLTDSDGQIPQQTLSRSFYNQTGDDTEYPYYPFQLTITRDGYNTYTQKWTPTEKEHRRLALAQNTQPGWTLAFVFVALLICVPLGLIFFIGRRR